MLLSLALSFFVQSQPFHWGEDVDQRYWQALHLLEVENNPADAVDALLDLVDQRMVVQFRGQAGIIKAQTYRAMLRNGQVKEAKALLPEIRREIEGTEFKVRAETIVAQAQRKKSVQGEIDPEFLALVAEQLVIPFSKGQDVKAKVLAYGGRLSPYFREIIVAGDDEQLLKPYSFALAASAGDQTVLNWLQKQLPEMHIDRAIHVLQGITMVSAFSPKADKSWVNFLIDLSGSGSVRIAQRTIDPLAQLATRHSNALARLDAILGDSEGLLSPLVLDTLIQKPKVSPPALLVKLIQGADENESDLVRMACYEGMALDALRLLAEEGDLDARRMLLWHMLRSDPPQRSDLEGDQDWFHAHTFDKNRVVQADDYPHQWRSFVRSAMDEQDSQLKQLGLMVAISYEDWGLALEFLERIETPRNLALMLPREWPDSVAPYLGRIINDSVEGLHAAELMLRKGAPIDHEVLSVILEKAELRGPVQAYLRKNKPTTPAVSDFYSAILQDPKIDPHNAYRIAIYLAGGEYPRFLPVANALESDRLPREERSNLFSNLGASSSRNLEVSALKDGKLIPDRAEAFKIMLALALKADWLTPKNKQQVVSSIKGIFKKLVDLELDISPFFLPLMDDEEMVRNIAGEFPEVVKTSSVLLQAIIEKQANVVTASNCGSFLESKSRAGLVLLGHPDSAVVAGMLDWFVIFGDAHMKLGAHEEAVLQCLSHPQKASSAARLLVQTGAHDDFVPDLINAWEMSDLENRSALMKAIGSIYDARLLPVILEGIQYPEQSVMKSAEQALERYATFREQKSTLQAWQEAGRKGDPEEFLIKKLESNDPKVRLAAIESLGTMHAKVALPFLVDLLEDTNADIAKASAVALKKINAASPKGDKRDKD